MSEFGIKRKGFVLDVIRIQNVRCFETNGETERACRFRLLQKLDGVIIEEDRLGFLERDAVLLFVDSALRVVPFKSHYKYNIIMN